MLSVFLLSPLTHIFTSPSPEQSNWKLLITTFVLLRLLWHSYRFGFVGVCGSDLTFRYQGVKRNCKYSSEDSFWLSACLKHFVLSRSDNALTRHHDTFQGNAKDVIHRKLAIKNIDWEVWKIHLLSDQGFQTSRSSKMAGAKAHTNST